MSTLPCYKLLQLKILGIQGSDSFKLVSAATRNVAKEELGAILATTELNKKEREQILINRGLSEAERKQALDTKAVSVSNLEAASTTNTLTMSTKAFGASLKGLWTTLKAHPFAAVLTAIAASAIILYSQLNYDKQLERLTESAEELAETKSEIENLNSELSTAEEKINELESKGNLSFVEEEELNRLRQTNSELKAQLANLEAIEKIKAQETLDKFVSVINNGDFWDPVNGASIEKLDAIKNLQDVAFEYEQYIMSLENQNPYSPYEYFNSINLDNSSEISDKNKSIIKKFKEQYSSLFDQYKNLFGNNPRFINTQGYTSSSTWQTYLDSYTKAYIDDYEKTQEAIDALEGTDYNLLNDKQKEAYNRAREKQWKIALTFSDEFGGLENVYQMIYNDRMFSEARDQIDGLINEDELTVDALSELINSNEKVKELFTRMGISMSQDGLESFIAWFGKPDNSDASSNSIVSKVEKIKEEFEDLTKELDSLQSTYNTVQSAIKDYNENGYLSIDNYQKMLELGDGYLSLLIDENGQLNLNEEAYQRVMQAKLQELTLNRVSTLLENILNMKQEEAQAYANADANYAEADSLMELINVKYQAAMIEAKTKDAELGGTTYQDAIRRSVSETSAWLSMMNSAIDGLGQYEDASDSASDSTDNLTESLRKQKDALENAKSDIQDLIDITIDWIKQEKEDEKEAYEDQKEHLLDLIDKRRELLETKKEEAELNKKLSEQQNTVAQNALAASLSSLDDSSAGRKSSKLAQDALTDSKSDLDTTLSDHEYDVRTKALDELKESTEEYYDKLIDEVDKYLDNERKLYEDACTMIDNDNGALYEKLKTYVYNHTTMTEAEFDHMWNNAQEGLKKYDNAHTPLWETMSELDRAIYNTALQIDNISTSVSNNVVSSINIAKEALGEYKSILDEIEASEFHGYYYMFFDGKKDRKYTSSNPDRELAAWDIQSQIEKDGYYIPTGAVVGGLKAYASGTLSATGGISMVGENGAELRILNQGDGIIPADITKNLMSIGVNPTEYFNNMANEIIWRGFSDNSSLDSILQDVSVEIKPNISTPISISIAGNATKETVDALKKLTPQIADAAAKKVMESALRYSSVPRKY